MNIKTIKDGLFIILNSYSHLLKFSLYFLLYTFIITGSSLLITLPLWYTATKHSTGYTIIVILLMITLTGLSLMRRLRQWVIVKQQSGMKILEIILLPIKKAAVFIFFTMWLYGIIFIYSLGLFLIAVLISAVYIIVLGYYIFIYRKINEKNYS